MNQEEFNAEQEKSKVFEANFSDVEARVMALVASGEYCSIEQGFGKTMSGTTRTVGKWAAIKASYEQRKRDKRDQDTRDLALDTRPNLLLRDGHPVAPVGRTLY